VRQRKDAAEECSILSNGGWQNAPISSGREFLVADFPDFDELSHVLARISPQRELRPQPN
jgi:hypothetical protein